MHMLGHPCERSFRVALAPRRWRAAEDGERQVEDDRRAIGERSARTVASVCFLPSDIFAQLCSAINVAMWATQSAWATYAWAVPIQLYFFDFSMHGR